MNWKTYLKKKGARVGAIVVAVVLVLALITGALGGRAGFLTNLDGIVRAPLQKAATVTAQWLESIYGYIYKYDQLKAENDRLGHLAGDQLIRKMADSLVAICDESCQAFRYGGDEFLLISENASEAQLKSLCGKWCGSTDISASFGYAYGSGSEIRDIIARADSNMYQAKKC